LAVAQVVVEVVALVAAVIVQTILIPALVQQGKVMLAVALMVVTILRAVVAVEQVV
jgi:hypothetical protein